MEKLKIELGPIQKTLLIPLWGRAMDYASTHPIVKDKYAHDIVSKLDYDFNQLAAEMTDIVRVNVTIRAHHFDNKLKKLIAQYPDATIVNIGAGLDTTFYRVDNGRIHWYDLDMPDSIALRRQLLPEGERNKYIISSAFDKSWYAQVKERSSKVIFISAGVLVYFTEEDVKGLIFGLADEFPGSEMIFEIYAPKLLELRQKSIAKQEHPSAMLRQMQWGVRSGKVIAGWSDKIKLVDQFRFYSHVPVTPDNKKVIKQFWLLNLFGMFRIVHLKLG